MFYVVCIINLMAGVMLIGVITTTTIIVIASTTTTTIVITINIIDTTTTTTTSSIITLTTAIGVIIIIVLTNALSFNKGKSSGFFYFFILKGFCRVENFSSGRSCRRKYSEETKFSSHFSWLPNKLRFLCLENQWLYSFIYYFLVLFCVLKHVAVNCRIRILI